MKWGITAVALLIGSCASRPTSVAKAGVDFSKIKTVQVRVGKKSLAPIVSRELIFAGLSAISSEVKQAKADAILKVDIARENPERRYLVRPRKKTMAQQTSASRENTATTIVFEEDLGHEPVEISGAQIYSQTVLGPTDSQLLATYAQVALTGELLDPASGNVLWAGTYTYEGIDLNVALEGAVRGLVREIPR